MLKRLVGRAKCVFGIHKRSRGKTVFHGGGHDTSVCRYCKTPMKSAPGGWVVRKD